MPSRHIDGVFAVVRIAVTTTMKTWRIGVLSLLLAASVAIAQEGVLVADKDESVETLDPKSGAVDTATALEGLSWQAAEVLIDAIKEFGNISREPIAVYRDDLRSDYVAYWMVEIGTSQYIIVSSSSVTADYMVSSQGPLPSPITELDLTAEEYGKECAEYQMMTPDGVLMCRDAIGQIIATTEEDLILSGNRTGDDPKNDQAHEYIEQNSAQLATLWAARAADVAKESVWDETQAMSSTDTNEVTSFTQGYVQPGEMIRVPVDKDTVSVKVKYTSESKTQTPEDVVMMQQAVCQMISKCDVDDDSSISLQQQTSVLHLNYIEVEISKDIPDALNGTQSVDFELRVEKRSGEMSVKYYSLDATRHRQKRYKEYKSYSAWSTRSIPDEGFFPNYWQHKIKKGCAVGCGPVAWAMVFGYLDRRAKYKTTTYGSGSAGLYRCGSDGTTGDYGCPAPSDSSSSSRLKKYIEHIAKRLGTLCVFKNGATPASWMDRIKSFFQARQKSGSPTVIQTNNIWKLFARQSIATATRSWIKSGWPVVVGTHEGSIFAWHYPVATKYRSRKRKYRNCVKIFWKIKLCGKWKTKTYYEMYTHQGGKNTQTKWRGMSLHYAAIAYY